ncbi:MAG TPA: ACT domain-containing protein [Pyrinomonadaceae bacterium]|nr:ACT domain-containing protein [Pyrinomonadaceae bacterium]HLE63089.1 ACT domain-containing protein [Pyrinomonadaceae bacterium]
MPKAKEFSVRIDDEPGTLAKVCQALADQGINIQAFHSVPWVEESLVRLVVDNPTKARSVLDTQKFKYKEAEVVQVKLPNQPGELALAASQLAEADININYAYCGSEAGTNAPLLIFGVADAGRAVKILDKAAAAAAGA